MDKMKSFLLLLCLAIFSVSLLEYCTSSQAKEVSVKSYLSKKKLIACMPGIAAGEEWLEEHPEGIPALDGWGHYTWKVSTGSDSAQFYFDQGINMYYSYHMIEAYASFAKASLFDSSLSMAYWGQALSRGPNINYPDITKEANTEALALIQKAKLHLTGAKDFEIQLVDAIENRYSNDTATDRSLINRAYSAAMKALYEKNPGNAEAYALYADALMVEHPWDLYEQDESPKSWTPPIVTVVEKGLEKFPMHPALNHYYIHVVEASSNPGRALPSASRLSVMMPQVAHMVHMPSHIYIRTGNYRQGIDVNTSAINGFQNYSAQYPAVQELAGLYLSHNQHMQVACAMMSGESKFAQAAAKQTRENIPYSYVENPSAFGNYIQSIRMLPTIVATRFGLWKQLADSPLTASTLDYEYSYQLYAKGMAYAHLGNLTGAKDYLVQLQEKIKTPILHEKYASFANAASMCLEIAEQVLKGTIALSNNNKEEAVSFFQKAVQIEDATMYNEPKDWLVPARHYLGDALLQSGRFAEAEKVYEKDLHINPSNTWSLAGLAQAQKALNKNEALAKTKVAFKKAAANADVTIRSSIIN